MPWLGHGIHVFGVSSKGVDGGPSPAMTVDERTAACTDAAISGRSHAPRQGGDGADDAATRDQDDDQDQDAIQPLGILAV